MTSSAETAFHKELDKKLWTAADKLRSNLDGAGSRTPFVLQDTLLSKLMSAEVRVEFKAN